jgi:YggT family protein
MNIEYSFFVVLITMFLSYLFLFSFLFRITRVNFYNPVVNFLATKVEPVSSLVLPLGNPLFSSLLFALGLRIVGLFVAYSDSYSLIFISILSFVDVVILSWVAPMNQHPIAELVNSLSDAVLSPIRKYLPSMGGLDFSPIIGLLLLNLVNSVLISLIKSLSGPLL